MAGATGVATCFAGAGSLSVLDTLAESNMNCGGSFSPPCRSFRYDLPARITSAAVSGIFSEPVVRGTYAGEATSEPRWITLTQSESLKT